MESIYHIVTIRVNETSRAHVWRLRSHYLGTGYDRNMTPHLKKLEDRGPKMIFVGYESGSKAYCAYDPIMKCVHVTWSSMSRPVGLGLRW
jgi:hypothetical protein